MGGCGPMILTMIILFGIIDVVYKPMTHMERFKEPEIETLRNIAMEVEFTSIILSSNADYQLFLDFERSSESATVFFTGGAEEAENGALENSPAVDVKINARLRELIGYNIRMNTAIFTGGESRLSANVISEISRVGMNYNRMGELQIITQYSREPDAFGLPQHDPSDNRKEKLDRLSESMVFLGMDLGSIPQRSTPDALWIIAALCFIFSIAQMVVQRIIQKKTVPEMPNAGAMKAMMLIGPVFSLIIVFTVPAGAGLYWATSYLIMMAQSIIIFKLWPPEKMREEAAERVKAKFGAIEATAKVVDVDEDGNEVVKEEKVSDMSKREQEEYYKKKLEAARKEDLEKYGE
jgi:YidC/Oxa1 family membrane protein insertase